MNQLVDVQVMKLDEAATIPAYARAGDAGFDLVALADVIIPPGETAKIRTGLAFAIPAGYELQIRPRSGISLKTKLRVSNSPGTIDSGYRGEVMILLDNTSNPVYQLKNGELALQTTNQLLTIQGEQYESDRSYPAGTYIVRKGERIAQGVLAQVPQAHFQVVTSLDETERGSGGFGSSGTVS